MQLDDDDMQSKDEHNRLHTLPNNSRHGTQYENPTQDDDEGGFEAPPLETLGNGIHKKREKRTTKNLKDL